MKKLSLGEFLKEPDGVMFYMFRECEIKFWTIHRKVETLSDDDFLFSSIVPDQYDYPTKINDEIYRLGLHEDDTEFIVIEDQDITNFIHPKP